MLARNYQCGAMYNEYNCDDSGDYDNLCVASPYASDNNFADAIQRYEARMGAQQQTLPVRTFVCDGSNTCASVFGAEYPQVTDLTYAQCRGLHLMCHSEQGSGLCHSLLNWRLPFYWPGSYFVTRQEPGYNATQVCSQSTGNYREVTWTSRSDATTCTSGQKIFCDVSSVTDSTTCFSEPAAEPYSPFVWSASTPTIEVAVANVSLPANGSAFLSP